MSTKRRPYIADFVLAPALVGLSIFVLQESLKLAPSPYEPLGPAFLPRALGVSLMILAVPIFVQGVRKWRARSTNVSSVSEAEKGTARTASELPAHQTRKRPLLSLFAGIATVFYIMSIRLLGFRVSTVVLVLVLGSVLYRRERRGRPATFFTVLAVLAFGISQLLYFVFTRVLIVNLP